MDYTQFYSNPRMFSGYQRNKDKDAHKCGEKSCPICQSKIKKGRNFTRRQVKSLKVTKGEPDANFDDFVQGPSSKDRKTGKIIVKRKVISVNKTKHVAIRNS